MTTGLLTLQQLVPKRLETTTGQYFDQLRLYGVKGFEAGLPINNTSTVYLGFNDKAQPITIAPGKEYILNDSEIGRVDTYNLWASPSSGAAGEKLFFVKFSQTGAF